MRKGIIIGICVLICALIPTASAENTVHNINTGEDFDTIQTAIDDPETENGHTITVDAGTYVENVYVNKRLTLQGEGADMVNVTAYSTRDHVFGVTEDYVNISGFNLSGTANYEIAGIYLNSVDHCNIFNNNVSKNRCGILLSYSSNNTLTNNTINSNYDGICLPYSSNNILYGNNALKNMKYGIRIDSSNNNFIYLNNFIENTANVYSDNMTTIWNSSSTIAYTYNDVEFTNHLGNYWSDYTGSDNNGDGIGDTPHNQDNYPLINYLENYRLTDIY